MPDKSGHHSERKRRHHRSHEHARSPFGDEDVPRRKEKRSSRRHVAVDVEPAAQNDVGVAVGRSGDISLSVEETNALRAKLGLAPLELGDKGPSDSQQRVVDNQSENYVHAPAKDVRKIRDTEALKDKLAVQKDKRTLYEKIASTRLFEAEEKETPVSSWVDKIREKERVKRQAQERAKLLTEMDDQLDTMDTISPLHQSSSNTVYHSSDLAGLKVEHKSDAFHEGKGIILTLKDKGILDEDADEDVLVNVNIVDDEKAEKNRENLRKMAGLAGIADEEDEEVLLGLRQKGILSKYDAEISGTQKSQFTIGSDGTYLPQTERMLEQLQAELRSGKQSLPDTELRVASEYYTTEEMQAKFKKRVRRVKTRVRSALTVDDLLDADFQPSEDSRNTDLGSRASRKERSHLPSHTDRQVGEIDIAVEVASSPGTSYDTHLANGITSNVIVEDDELRSEIEKTIDRVIKSKSAIYVKPEEVAAHLLAHKSENSDASVTSQTLQGQSQGVVFDSTAEFYKSIGSGLQETMRQHARLNHVKPDYSDNEDDETKGSFFSAGLGMNIKSEDIEDMSMSDEDVKLASTRWHTVGDDPTGRRKPQQRNTAAFPGTAAESMANANLSGVLDDEPLLNAGVFSALKLAEKKGYIEKGKEKRSGPGTMVNLMAKHFVQEDVRYDDIDAKFAKRDRYSGPLSDFKEIKNYKPDVKLEYVDELGRQLNAKEAFRQLSHKFHGKGSSKNKTEKRMKKIKEEFLLKASTSSDTPLGTAEKLNKKLKSISQPYVILSGKNAAVKNLTK